MTSRDPAPEPPPGRRTNPFATRYIRPAAARFLFPPGASAASLVARLQTLSWRGQIVGPHGSGKSTLLEALLPTVAAAGKTLYLWRVTPGAPRGLLAAWRQPWTSGGVLVIDGYEQLSTLARAFLQLRLRLAGKETGLLVTTHRPVRGLPLLVQTQPTLELARQIVADLLPAGDATVSAADVAAAFQSARGDLREMLLALYDLYRNRSG